MRCPHCNSNTRQQRTFVITAYLRDIVQCCKNKECGHVFVTQEEFIRSVIPPVSTEAANDSSATA